MAYLLLLGGIVLLLLAGDWLVKGSVDLALRLKVNILVVGMTVVSFATSAPELLVSLDAAMDGYTDISFGNVIGSNIANIALILGLTATIFPMRVSPHTYRIDFWIMIVVSLILLSFIWWDNLLSFWESLVLVLILIAYNWYQIWSSRRSRGKKTAEQKAAESQPEKSIFWMLGYLVAGIIGLRYGAAFLIDGAVELAGQWGISERIIGITVVSVGTSLPELAASLIASFKGEHELSLGNLVGSNIFNILAVLGISGLIVELPVKNEELLTFDMPYFLGVALLLYPFMRFIRKGTIDRWQGFVMFLAYLLYLYLVF